MSQARQGTAATALEASSPPDLLLAPASPPSPTLKVDAEADEDTQHYDGASNALPKPLLFAASATNAEGLVSKVGTVGKVGPRGVAAGKESERSLGQPKRSPTKRGLGDDAAFGSIISGSDAGRGQSISHAVGTHAAPGGATTRLSARIRQKALHLQQQQHPHEAAAGQALLTSMPGFSQRRKALAVQPTEKGK